MDRNSENPMISVDKIVALRKESVDRNKRAICRIKVCIESLSARRAWIEIGISFARKICIVVALRKESVDRNSCWLLA